MTNPTMFGMNGGRAMVGGEAGPEAILPLSKLWEQLEKNFERQNRLLQNKSSNDKQSIKIVLKLNELELGQATVNSLKALADHNGEIDLPF